MVKAYFRDGSIREFASINAAKEAEGVWFILPFVGYRDKIVVFEACGIKPAEYYKEPSDRELKFVDSKGEYRTFPFWASPMNDWTFENLDNPKFVKILAESSTWKEVEEKVNHCKKIEKLESEIRFLKFQKEKLQEENKYLKEELERVKEKLEYYELDSDDIPNEIRRHIIGLVRAIKKEFETVDC